MKRAAPKKRARRAKIGRPVKVPVFELEAARPTLERMGRAGCSLQEVADFFGVSLRTLRAPHMRDEIDRVMRMSYSVAKLEVREKQLASALSGQPVGQIWYGKQHLNQSDRQQVTGANGGPLEYVSTSVEHLAEALDRVAEKVSGGASQ
jgi:hypothetical protein